MHGEGRPSPRDALLGRDSHSSDFPEFCPNQAAWALCPHMNPERRMGVSRHLLTSLLPTHQG